jgi:alpha-tubulin suppressor-like RCC1 family protein
MNCPKCFAHVPEFSLSCPICGVALTLDGQLAVATKERPAAPAPHHPHGPAHTLEPAMELASHNAGGRILVWFIAAAALVFVAYGAWYWKSSHKPPSATWVSPPQPLPGLPSGGAAHTCTISASGMLLCWGNSEIGQLGDTLGAPTGVPCTVCTQGIFTQLDAGDAHTCAVRSDGSVLCWGSNNAGQLGTPTTTECVSGRGRVPCALLPVVAQIEHVRSVAAGASHTCALGTDSTITCWGSNYRGQLGVQSPPPGVPTVQVQAREKFIAVAAGQNHTCALAADGRLLCWGWNDMGQLGTSQPVPLCGPTAQTRSPCSPKPLAVSTDMRFSAVALGGEHSCALDANGAAYCWGSNRVGQLGTGNHDNTLVPVAVAGGKRFTALTAGLEFTCGLDDAAGVWCWGSNVSGQLGTGDSTDSAVPVHVPLTVRALSLGSGNDHACVVAEGNRVFCWGDGREGELGNGSRTNSRTPTEAGVDRGG